MICRTTRSVNAVDPLEPESQYSEAVPNPQSENDYSLRLDHKFTAANQMNGRYEIHRMHQTNAGVGLLVSCPNRATQITL